MEIRKIPGSVKITKNNTPREPRQTYSKITHGGPPELQGLHGVLPRLLAEGHPVAGGFGIIEPTGGIFVIDQFGSMHAGQKVPGVFQHSSMTGGHCCRFAGSITVQDGRVLALTPHSGHYVPTQTEYDHLVADWRRDGLDLSEAEIGGFVKDKTHKKRARQAAAAAMEGGER